MVVTWVVRIGVFMELNKGWLEVGKGSLVLMDWFIVGETGFNWSWFAVCWSH